MYKQIDINEHPEVVKAINDELNAGNIIEIKKERTGITIVRIERKLKLKDEV